jgi:putative SOS response-associated peptidase YedK
VPYALRLSSFQRLDCPVDERKESVYSAEMKRRFCNLILRETTNAGFGAQPGGSTPLPSINANSETAADKPAFRDPLKFRRCLIPEGELFAFAGLWDGWKDATGNGIRTCSILTTTPNAVTSAIHDRMPVIVHPNGYDLWLDPGMTDAQVASELLKPYDARLMRAYPVSTRINHVANDDVECSQPVRGERNYPPEGRKWNI